MNLKTIISPIIITLAWVFILAGCTASASERGSSSAAAGVSDVELKQRVEAAIANASDVPEQIQVEANDGVVRLIGSLNCENCGGNRTPGGLGTIQQSIGAVVRAVPGVDRVEFALSEQP